MIPSLEGWPTKAKEAPSPHEVRMAPLDTNPVFQRLGDSKKEKKKSILLEKSTCGVTLYVWTFKFTSIDP